MHDTVRVTALEETGGDFWLDTSELLDEIHLPQRRIPEYFGYDAHGSELFEHVTTLPTYYLTATELDLFRRYDSSIAGSIRSRSLVELGSGSAKKTKVLLSACVAERDTVYMPVDVSVEMLEHSVADLTDSVPGLRVHALWGRYTSAFRWLREADREQVTLAFLGSTIGNMAPSKRARFYEQVASALRPGDQFLVTADLHKPVPVFVECYNDPPDRTAFAEFRLNRLTHLNRLFDGDFDVQHYYPRARVDDTTSTVEAHVYATED